MNILVEQIALSFHKTTRPQFKHIETKIERDFKRTLQNMPSNPQRRKDALKNLQHLNEKWVNKQSVREKKRLHYSLVRGSKIKRAIDKVLNPTQDEPVHLWDNSTNPPTLVSEPEKVGAVFSECLSHLGGDPEFRVPDNVLQPFIDLLPKCPQSMAQQPLPKPDVSWLREISGKASPSKATGEDEINYYIISLCPPGIQKVLLEAIIHVLREGPPPKWARARVYLLYKKGDARTASNYRPICLIQAIVKLAAAWQCTQLTALTSQHELLHKCQHGGLKKNRCGDHIYDVVARMLLTKGRLYHLYIDFNKAFNSIPLAALWKTLHGYSLPRELISSIQRLYTHAHEQPIVGGIPTSGHAQHRGVQQGCPLSPLLFNLYVNMMFFYLDSKIEWGIEKSIHAFIDDILFRARSLKDVKLAFEAFDGPARTLGLDMNVDKTELHALRGSGHTEIVSQHGGKISTLDSRGQPRSCYKYLGDFFYNSDAQSKVLDYVHAEINAFFARLAPLSLTATELISLVNKQLIPVLTYRLMAGPITDAQLYKIQQSIWHNVA